MKGWFFIDMVTNVPIALFKYTSVDREYSDFMNIVTFNMAYIPRLYIILLSTKLVRIFKNGNMEFKILRKLGIRIKIT
jgi:hypothetical protein